MRIKKRYIIISAILSFFLIIAITCDLWLKSIARFLVTNDELMNVDAIVVLDCGNGPAYNYGVKLYRSGYGKKIIVVGGSIDLPGINTTYADLAMQWIVNSLEVPGEAVMAIEDPTTIYEAALYVRDMMLERDFRSAIIVSLPHHTRRAKMIFRRIFGKQEDANLMFISPNIEQFQIEKWWTRENELNAVVTEYCRLILYFFH